MSGTKRTLVALAPDGTEVTQQTSGNYSVAGLIQRESGSWFIAAHGNSWASVKSRTSAMYGRGCYRQMHVADLREVTAPVVREYFGTHNVTVISLFREGQTGLGMKAGWTDTGELGLSRQGFGLKGGASMIRKLAKDGYTAVHFLGRTGGTPRFADFQTDELLKSLRSRPRVTS